MKKVLFVCRSNAACSQMAEGHAGRFGKGVIKAQSAGIEPAAELDLMTIAAMKERGIDLEACSPKGIEAFKGQTFDLCVSFDGVSDERLGLVKARERRHWGDIKDPIGGRYADFRRAQVDIGSRVLALIKEFRGKG